MLSITKKRKNDFLLEFLNQNLQLRKIYKNTKIISRQRDYFRRRRRFQYHHIRQLEPVKTLKFY